LISFSYDLLGPTIGITGLLILLYIVKGVVISHALLV